MDRLKTRKGKNTIKAPTFRWLKSHPASFLAFGFGSGLSPIAPGTAGTLVGVLLSALYLLAGVTPLGLLLTSALFFILGIYVCGSAEKQLGVHDYGGIVWDEIVAMMLILSAVPFQWVWWLLAFVLFRFFDALKPWPISWFDRHVSGAFGVMVDDLVAAIVVILILVGAQILWGEPVPWLLAWI